MNIFQVPLVLVVGVLLGSGCATGPKLLEVRNQFPKIKNGEARIFVYRTSSLGAAVQPDVEVDDQVITSASPGRITFYDLAPGKHKIACTTEKTNELEFEVAANDTKYIKLVPYFGFLIAHIDPQLVDKAEAEEEISQLRYVNSPKMLGRLPASLTVEKK